MYFVLCTMQFVYFVLNYVHLMHFVLCTMQFGYFVLGTMYLVLCINCNFDVSSNCPYESCHTPGSLQGKVAPRLGQDLQVAVIKTPLNCQPSNT